MKVSSISNNNTNFQSVNVSKKTLRTLGCTREELLNNDFIQKISKDHDIRISVDKVSIFKKIKDFILSIGTVKPKAPAYKFELEAFKKIESHDYSDFIGQMDYIMQKIASIPNTPENAELNSYFISVLRTLPFWKPMPKNNPNLPEINRDYWEKAGVDFSKSVALRALENNNLELLKFLKEKGENFNQCLDLLQTGQVSDEAKEILAGIKRQDAKIFELEDCFSSPYLVERFFHDNPDIDINSRNKRGDTLAIKAIKDGNVDLLRFLGKLEGVDWNVYDANGQNLLLLALIKNDYKMILYLQDLPDGELNASSLSILDYDDFSAPFSIISPLEYALKEDKIEWLVKFSNINVMEDAQGTKEPFIFRAVDESIYSFDFKPLLRHPSLDLSVKNSQGEDIVEYALSSNDSWIREDMQEFLPELVVNSIKKEYEKTGEISLDKLDAVLDVLASDHRKARDLLEKTVFNSIDDTIGHLLCDFHLEMDDFNSMRKMSKILQKLCKNIGYKIDSSKNAIGQTPISKAIECENVGLLKLLLEIDTWIIRKDPETTALRNCNNEEIHKLFSGRLA